ncbi:MAG: outer membrane protein assembly factor BamE precursor [Pseudomonadota bacterium]
MSQKFTVRMLLISIGLGLAGCSMVPKLPNPQDWASRVVTPYRPDVLQGNVITREQMQLIREGLSREQVRAILGTPLLQSVFHAQRWDYVFAFQRSGQPVQQRRLTLIFENDRLVSYEGDDMPAEQEFVSSLAKPVPVQKEQTLTATPESLQAWQKQNRGTSVREPELAPGTPPAVYPPLQPEGVLQQ